MATFTSPFSAYLKTNYVPEDRDRHHILEILEQPASESKKLEEEISSIDETLKALLQQRQDLQTIIGQHERIMSTFWMLSDDVLREIFLRCLPSDHNTIMSIHEPPFVLALVCKRWKSVVYETPRLWARIHVPLSTYPTLDGGDIPEEDFQHTLSKFNERIVAHCGAIHTWLSRSRICPLSISFHPPESYPVHARTHLTPYFETLLGFSSRWHTIELTILTGDLSTFFASIPTSAVPMLHTLNITFAQYWQDWGQPHSSVWNNSGFINAPSMRKLGFYHCPLSLSSLQIDWSRLTWLDIPDPRGPWQDRGLTLKETHALLAHCQELVHISIDVEDSLDPGHGFSPLSLPHLKSIDILDNAIYLGNLLDVIYFRRLRTIRFQSLFKPSSRRRSNLNILLTRTEPAKIESLSTNLQMLTHEEFMDIVHQTPNMTAFCNEPSRRGPSDDQGFWLRAMVDFPIDILSAAFSLLTPEAEAADKALWPNLIHVDLGKIRKWTDAGVLKFIEARMDMEMEGIRKLKTVKANFYRDMMEDIRPALGRYIDDGLSVVLNYPSSSVAIPGSIRPRKPMFKRHSMFRP